MEKRVAMCQWFQEKLAAEPEFLENLWFSDEAHFLLSGHVNSKNCVHWGSERPEEVLERPLHSAKCTAWVALSKHGVIGPFWFETENGHATTINTGGYIQTLEKFWQELGQRGGADRGHQWFQQDGATPHCSNASLEWLRLHFGTRLIGRRLAVEWSPHSPDLSPLDFFLWGYVKSKAYANKPQTISDLKAAITQVIAEITVDQCRRTIDNFRHRIESCLNRRGRHMEHAIH